MTPSQFGVEIALAEHEAVLSLQGELDLDSAPQLRRCVASLVDQGVCQITMDLAELSLLDSTGLTVLVQASKRVRERGGDLALQAPTPGTWRVLEITGLTEVFAIH